MRSVITEEERDGEWRKEAREGGDARGYLENFSAPVGSDLWQEKCAKVV